MGYGKQKITQQQPDKVLWAWVRKANSWCRTEFKDGKQIQTWHSKSEGQEMKNGESTKVTD